MGLPELYKDISDYFRKHRKLTLGSAVAIGGTIIVFLFWGTLEHKLFSWTAEHVEIGSMIHPVIKLLRDGFTFGVPHPFTAAFNMAGAFCICLVISAFVPFRRLSSNEAVEQLGDLPFFPGTSASGIRRIEGGVYGLNNEYRSIVPALKLRELLSKYPNGVH